MAKVCQILDEAKNACSLWVEPSIFPGFTATDRTLLIVWSICIFAVVFVEYRLMRFK